MLLCSGVGLVDSIPFLTHPLFRIGVARNLTRYVMALCAYQVQMQSDFIDSIGALIYSFFHFVLIQSGAKIKAVESFRNLLFMQTKFERMISFGALRSH
ncbi:MAG: hypothetical protein HQ500_12575 [Flavobacteriales bacterium]|nr:hypothetical protein [Flavobacteriales bacterium]